jgi:hypothetical protein
VPIQERHDFTGRNPRNEVPVRGRAAGAGERSTRLEHACFRGPELGERCRVFVKSSAQTSITGALVRDVKRSDGGVPTVGEIDEQAGYPRRAGSVVQCELERKIRRLEDPHENSWGIFTLIE